MSDTGAVSALNHPYAEAVSIAHWACPIVSNTRRLLSPDMSAPADVPSVTSQILHIPIIASPKCTTSLDRPLHAAYSSSVPCNKSPTTLPLICTLAVVVYGCMFFSLCVSSRVPLFSLATSSHCHRHLDIPFLASTTSDPRLVQRAALHGHSHAVLLHD